MAINYKSKQSVADAIKAVGEAAKSMGAVVASAQIPTPVHQGGPIKVATGTGKKPKTLEKKEAKAKTTIQFPDKSTAESEQVVDAKVFDVPPCNVGVQASMTLNLGNYNSVRIGVSLHMPCLEKDLDETFTKAQQWVDGKMAKVQADVLAGKNGESNDPPF